MWEIGVKLMEFRYYLISLNTYILCWLLVLGPNLFTNDCQMVVEEMNILTTVFLRYDNTKLMYPNSVLSIKPIHNYYRSPDMGDAVEFCIHVGTPADKIAAIRQRTRNAAARERRKRGFISL